MKSLRFRRNKCLTFWGFLFFFFSFFLLLLIEIFSHNARQLTFFSEHNCTYHSILLFFHFQHFVLKKKKKIKNVMNDHLQYMFLFLFPMFRFLCFRSLLFYSRWYWRASESSYRFRIVSHSNKHAGSDPEAFLLRPVMAVTARVQPKSGWTVYAGSDFPHPFQLRFFFSPPPKKSWLILCKTDPDLIWMAWSGFGETHLVRK